MLRLNGAEKRGCDGTGGVGGEPGGQRSPRRGKPTKDSREATEVDAAINGGCAQRVKGGRARKKGAEGMTGGAALAEREGCG